MDTPIQAIEEGRPTCRIIKQLPGEPPHTYQNRYDISLAEKRAAEMTARNGHGVRFWVEILGKA